jgi:hypothetical protein
MTKEQGEAKKLESEQKASVGKGEAVGEGGGMAAGAIGGAALGASIGSIIPGAGTVVGGLVGGAIGGFAGSSVGKAVGGYAVKGYQGVKSMFGFGGEDKATPVAGAPVAALGGEATVESLQATRDKLAKAGPATDSAQSKLAHKNQLQQLDRAIAAKSKESGASTQAKPVDRTPAMLATSAKVKKEGVGVAQQDDKLRNEATKLGLDPNNAEGKFEGGQLTEITDKTTGKAYPIAVDPSKQSSVNAAREMRAANDRPAQLAKNTTAGVATPASAIAPTPSSADQIATQSAENASILTPSSAPVIINAPSNSTNVSNQTSSYTAKSPTRNSESSVRKFIDSRYAF